MATDTDRFIIAERTFLAAALETYITWFGRALGLRRLREAFKTGRLGFEGETRDGTIHTSPPLGFNLMDAHLHACENAIVFGHGSPTWIAYHASQLAGSRGERPSPSSSTRVWLFGVVVWSKTKQSTTKTKQKAHKLDGPLRAAFPNGVPPELAPADIEKKIKPHWEKRYLGIRMPHRDTITRHARRRK
jgi:hypothetical protein